MGKPQAAEIERQCKELLDKNPIASSVYLSTTLDEWPALDKWKVIALALASQNDGLMQKCAEMALHVPSEFFEERAKRCLSSAQKNVTSPSIS